MLLGWLGVTVAVVFLGLLDWHNGSCGVTMMACVMTGVTVALVLLGCDGTYLLMISL